MRMVLRKFLLVAGDHAAVDIVQYKPRALSALIYGTDALNGHLLDWWGAGVPERKTA